MRIRHALGAPTTLTRRCAAPSPVGRGDFRAFALACFLTFTTSTFAADPPPADDLLKLVPADAGAVLAMDHLRDRWGAIAASGLAREVQALPAFKAWLESPGGVEFVQARDRIMGFLQTSHGEIRDDVLGDAVVLAILLPTGPAGGLSQPRGLLAVKARRPELLKRLVEQLDDTQRQNGEIAAVDRAEFEGVSYVTRRYPAGSDKPAESYVIFPDGMFAFANSEPLIRDVIGRKAGKAGGPSFAEAAGFATASRGLAERPLARAFISPTLLARAFESVPDGDDPQAKRVAEAARKYVGSLDHIGAALVVEDAKVQFQVTQAFRSGAAGGSLLGPLRVGPVRAGEGPWAVEPPPTAVAAASLGVDVAGLYGLLAALPAEPDRAKLAKLETLATALLMGRDLRGSILPALGPRMIAYLDGADAGTGPLPLPLVASLEIADEPGASGPPTAAALGNALRGVLAALALDEKRVPLSAKVVERDGVTSLDVPYPFAFAVDAGNRRLTLGSSPAAVARSLKAGAGSQAGGRFRGIQAAAFPDCEAYVAVDLAALGDLAAKHRDRLVAAVSRRQRRTPADVSNDLDAALRVLGLFDSAYLAGRAEADLVEYRLGLARKPEASAPAP